MWTLAPPSLSSAESRSPLALSTVRGVCATSPSAIQTDTSGSTALTSPVTERTLRGHSGTLAQANRPFARAPARGGGEIFASVRPVEIVPVADEHLDEAASLLAARHTRHRETEPLLPERYEDPAAALEELEAAWRATGASGSAALRGSRLV